MNARNKTYGRVRYALLVCAGICIFLPIVESYLYRHLPSVHSISAPTQSDVTDDAIVAHYHERRPYYVTEGEEVRGLCADPVNRVFQKAGISYRWQKTPPKRQMNLLVQESGGKDCFIGWFKTPDRERYGTYTRPIYQDLPHVAIALSEDDRFRSGQTIERLLKNTSLVLLRKTSYSYGAYIDEKLQDIRPNQTVTSASNLDMLRMVESGRADYFFIAPEEAEELTGHSGLSKTRFKFIHFSDAQPGNKRYILCSRRIDEEIVRKIDEAIEEVIEPLN